MRILLLGAFEKEIAVILEKLNEHAPITQTDINRYKCHTLKYHNHEIFISLTGVGIGPAALATFALGKELTPDLIIMCGTAGALLGSAQNDDMQVGDIMVSQKVVYIDQYQLFQLLPNIPAFAQCAYDPHNNERITHEYNSPNQLMSIAKNLPNLTVISGTVGVSNFFPIPKHLLNDCYQLNCKVAEMESSGVFQAAKELNIPAFTVRVVSNLLTIEGDDLGTTPESVQLCSENISKFILAFIGSNDLTPALQEIKRESKVHQSDTEFVSIPFRGSLDIHRKGAARPCAPIGHKKLEPNIKNMLRAKV